MDRDLDRQEYETWDRVLTNVVPHDHIVQLYQDQDFLNRAVCRFAGAGLANGEGVILVSTLSHWNGFHAQLEAENVDVRSTPRSSCPASCGTPCRTRPYSLASSGTSSQRPVLEGATQKCVCGERW